MMNEGSGLQWKIKKVVQWVMGAFTHYLKWIEYLISLPVLRLFAKQINDRDLVDLAIQLSGEYDKQNIISRDQWGDDLMGQAPLVAAEGVVSDSFRKSYIKRVHYLVIFGLNGHARRLLINYQERP